MCLFLIRRWRTHFYSTILKSVLLLFIITNLLCFLILFGQEDKKDIKSESKNDESDILFNEILHKHFVLVHGEWRFKPSHVLNKTKQHSLLNCSALERIKNVKYLASGYTKSTFKTELNDREICLKTLNINGYDVHTCSTENNISLHSCYLKVASKLLQEIVLFQNIQHENIVQILGYCIPEKPDFKTYIHTIVIFEEIGQPIDVITLLQSSWEDRLKISLELTRLLQYLSESSISLNDFRRQQFVLASGKLKLIDIDDIGLHEQKCDTEPCCIPNPPIANSSICIPCVNNFCYGYNERMNIVRTWKHFISHIFPHGAPPNLNHLIKGITMAFEFALWNVSYILEKMNTLTDSYRRGLYRNTETNFLAGYEISPHKDVPKEFDYRCPLVISGSSCSISVVDHEEAAEMCSADLNCKAFVLTNVRTWTGRTMAYLKSGTYSIVNNLTQLYVKKQS